MSPALLVGLLLVLIGAQTAHAASPRRFGYPLALALAAAGVVAGELVALWLHRGGPTLGSLHPVADAAGIAAAEVAGAIFRGPGTRHRRA